MMRRVTLVAMFLAIGLFGCKGCDDTSGNQNNTENNTNNQTIPEACEDRDGDGTPSGLTCDGAVDCDDADPDVHPDADESCDDDIDNNCDGEVNEGCLACDNEGATRPCGNDVGRCTQGIQTCTNGEWSNCDGSQGPFSETCNGEDDDCDGEIDEGGDVLCNDGIECNGTEVCDAGACVPGDAVDCSDLDGPCVVGVCSEKDGGCKAAPVENGTSCEDGSFCTETGVCNLGVCEAPARDCSSVADGCNIGVCDEAADECVQQPVSDGTACDDGEFCTVNDTCTTGVCGGQGRDCSGVADQCNMGVCDEAADECATAPVADNTPCDDGLYCNVDEVCLGGTCTAGEARECGAAGGSCRDGVCDEANDTCDGDPVPDGTTCEDGQFCTTSDTCAAGVCVGGRPRDCSGSDGLCKVGQCNEMLNQCVPTNAPDNTVCDDNLYCTESTLCQQGNCVGVPRDCTAFGDACNAGTCNEMSDSCVATPRSDGTACPDNLFCTVSEVCQQGSCDTTPRDCSTNADQCNDSTCDEAMDACTPDPLPDGTMCNDGRFCTDNDACVSGACQGGGPLDCDAIVGGNCLITSCNESAQMCEATPDPVCCDVNMDADLDGYNECDDCNDTNAAVRPGATEFCNGIDDDCDGDIDEDFDSDGDGYSICAIDPLTFDCDDSDPNVNPGTAEICDDGMNGNTGNGVDDDCDGYIDEGCNPCTTTDEDNDGWSECDGDCNDNDADMYPTRVEDCDGKDNDCNIFTTPNCFVSDECNHDGDGNFGNDPDVCGDDMICAEVFSGRGSNASEGFRCTAFCNSSATGPIGDGCQTDQTCALDLLYSANVHGCAVNTDVPGSLLGGASCSKDENCRSLQCERLATGPNGQFCFDFCSTDSDCAAGSSCRLFHRAGGFNTTANADGRCWPDNITSGSDIGASCGSDINCAQRACMTDPNTSQEYCTNLCCTDSDCPSGYSCTLQGIAERSVSRSTFQPLVVTPESDAPACTSDSQCAGEGGLCFNGSCTYPLFDTTGQCTRDVNGQGTRRGGQACSANSDCASNFCEKDLGICIEMCCADSTCPNGLGCELTNVETRDDEGTNARVCLSFSVDGILERM